jgi:hypothetical protein
MLVCVGDETGLLKLVSNDKTVQTVTVAGGTEGDSYEQTRRSGVVGIARRLRNDKSSSLSVLRVNGTLESYHISNDFNCVLENSSDVSDIVPEPIGIKQFNDDQVVCYGSTGHVAIVSQTTSVKSVKLQVSGPLSVLSPVAGGFAAAGRENDVKIYDVNSEQPVWSAKNVAFDSLKYYCYSYILL